MLRALEALPLYARTKQLFSKNILINSVSIL